MRKKIIVISLLSAAALAGLAFLSLFLFGDPLAFGANDQLFTLEKRVFRIRDEFSAAELTEQSKECGAPKSDSHFTNLLATFDSADEGMEYRFTYRGESQDPASWIVTLVPNTPRYENLLNFKNDFDVCEAGGERYPATVSDRYLLFVSSCGSGFDEGSALSNGCEEVRTFLEPTLRLE